MKTLHEMVEKQIEYERMAAETYDKFSARFSNISQASSIWRQMAEEEERHAQALHWLKSLLTEAKVPVRKLGESESKAMEEERLRQEQQVIEKAHKETMESDFTFEQAVLLTEKIEHSATEIVAHLFKTLPEEKVFRDVANQIAGDEKEHCANVDALMSLLSPPAKKEA